MSSTVVIAEVVKIDHEIGVLSGIYVDSNKASLVICVIFM